MRRFMVQRINRRNVVFALLIGIVFSIWQILQSFLGEPNLLKNKLFFDSPYTKWLSVDPFNFTPIIFFMVLPLISSLPAASLIREDLNNGFIYQVLLKNKNSKVLISYLTMSFITGIIVVAIPLIINLIAYLEFLPNIRPDNLVNINILAINKNTLFVTWFYEHPLFHAILFIIITSIWSGLFASFATVNNFLFENKFIALLSGLFLQIILFVTNTVVQLPNQVSFVPADFLKEVSNANVDLNVLITMSLIIIIYCVFVLFGLGRRRIVI